ncbi:uncharacterized protein LOC134041005 [Osmerus eperlanus]|uniref:uncharacterized protein LOC134041005 n=1 Tax=Osmerus eperlanus TaxID=29151 RepID=UPI002E0E3652
MIRQKYKQEMFAKPVAPRSQEPLTSQAKNTTMHVNGQYLRLAAKNGPNSKTPGLLLSATHGDEAAGQLTPTMPTQEGTAQRDSLLLRSPLPDSEREGANLPPRRPQKLAPLELPKEVREAQRQKIKGIQQEAKAAARKLDVAGHEPYPRKVKAGGRETDDHKHGVRLPEDAASQAAPPPVSSKPAPPTLASDVKAPATRGAGSACQNSGTLQQETAGGRRLRLKREERLEEDQSKSNMSTEGSSVEEGKLAQRGHSKGQRAERALKEASRMLEKVSRRNAGPPQQSGDMEVSGRAIRRKAVSDLQDAVL